MPIKLITHGKDMKSTVAMPGLARQIPDHDPQEMHVSLWAYDAGLELSGHSHDEAEVAYVVKGKAALTVGDNPPDVIEQGDFFYTPSGTNHAIKVIEDLRVVFFSRPKGSGDSHSHADGKPHSH